jgi:hypothetical protein
MDLEGDEAEEPIGSDARFSMTSYSRQPLPDTETERFLRGEFRRTRDGIGEL